MIATEKKKEKHQGDRNKVTPEKRADQLLRLENSGVTDSWRDYDVTD